MNIIKIALITLCLVGCSGNTETPAVNKDYVTAPMVVVLPSDWPNSPATAQFIVPGKTLEEMQGYTFINSCSDVGCTKLFPDYFKHDGTAVKEYFDGFLGNLTIDQFNAQNTNKNWVYADSASTIAK